MDMTPTTEGGGTPRPVPDRGGGRSRRRVVAVVAVVALVAGGAAVAGWGSGPSPDPSSGPSSGSAPAEGLRSTTPAITAPGVPGAGSARALAGLQPPTGSDAASGAPAPGSAGAPAGRPAPAGGGATVDAAGPAVLDPVPVGTSVRVGAAVQARVDSVTSARVRPRGPGDIAGPAALVVLRLVNTSERPVDLAGLAVTATAADGAPAIPSDGEPSDVLTGSLPPRGERTGTYVFGLRGTGEGAASTAGLRLEVGLSSAPEVAVVVAG